MLRMSVAVCALLAGMSLPAGAQDGDSKNPALLIGNGRYAQLKDLSSVKADIDSIKPALEARGFTVDTRWDLDLREMNRAIASMAKQAQGKDFALVYFSGYGRRFSGKDFLLPTDASAFKDWTMLAAQAVSIESIAKALAGTAKTCLIIMDSGRSLPEGAPDTPIGMEAKDGVWVLYATQAGKYANAGKPGDEHGPFTQAFLEALGWDPLSMKALQRLVQERLTVLTKDELDGLQIPELYGRTELAGKSFLPSNSAAKRLPPEKEETAKKAVAAPPMIYFAGGDFIMGNVLDDRDGMENAPPHPVTLSPFSIGKYETTFEDYDAFCAATGRPRPDDNGWGRGMRPVIGTDWYDAVEYCNWASEREGLKPCYTVDKTKTDPRNGNRYALDPRRWTVSCDWSAGGYRLPSEAEWEYAARDAGRQVRFGNGRNTLDPAAANFNPAILQSYSQPGASRGKTLPVGSLVPNLAGLYDMSGNAWEWCWDWYGEESRYGREETNPHGPESGPLRVIRGGSWETDAQAARASFRGDSASYYLSSSKGFRIARSEQKRQ
jgi:formylglycine-generating enzyme required for sulfatase activity